MKNSRRERIRAGSKAMEVEGEKRRWLKKFLGSRIDNTQLLSEFKRRERRQV